MNNYLQSTQEVPLFVPWKATLPPFIELWFSTEGKEHIFSKSGAEFSGKLACIFMRGLASLKSATLLSPFLARRKKDHFFPLFQFS